MAAHAAATKTFTPSSLSLFHFNARSILPKMSELHTTAISLKPDIIAVTETWLSKEVPDSAVLLPGYSTLIRVDRSGTDEGKRGGGVLILIHDAIQATPRPDLRTWSESAWAEIRLISNRTLIIGCLYRPPNGTNVASFTADLECSLDKTGPNRSEVVLVGDFNAKSPSWLKTDAYNTAGKALEELNCSSNWAFTNVLQLQLTSYLTEGSTHCWTLSSPQLPT